MAIFNGVSIADPSGDNNKSNSKLHFDEARKDDSLPKLSDGDQDILNNNPRKHPSSKGFDTADEVTVPITQTENLDLKKKQYEDEQDLKADVNIFSESSALDTEAAKAFVADNHYLTIITTSNPWVDPETGRAHLFEQARQPSRLM